MSSRSKSATRKSVKDHSGKARQKAHNKLSGRTRTAREAKLNAARMVANAVTMGFMGIEKKFLDTTVKQTAVGAAAALTGGEYDPSATSGSGGGSGGCIGALSVPAQGDTEQSRDGKRIVIDSLILKGNVNFNASASAAPTEALKVFVAVVLDTQTNGAQLNSEDVFKNLAADAVLNVNPTKNLLFGKRFRILKSQVYDLTPPGAYGATANNAHNGTQREFDWYIPFKGGLPVNLNAGTSADVANCIDNSLHVVAFSSVAGAEICYNSRIRFQG